MTHAGLTLAVFASDAVITFLGWQELDAWLVGRRWRVIVVGAVLTAVIDVNAMGFVLAGWPMIIPSVLGGALGSLVAFRVRLS
jgi:hypothetical protein